MGRFDIMPGSRNGMMQTLIVVGGVLASIGCKAQTTQYFPSGVSGYDQDFGVTVQSRIRPLYEPEGIRVGSFIIRPNLDQTIFDNTNVNGLPGSGSWGSQTSASVSAESDWIGSSLNGSVGVNHFQYFSLPTESHTDWNVGLGGGYTIGEDQLSLAYSHQAYNQLGVSIGAIESETPMLDQTDTAQLSYAFHFPGFVIYPNLSGSLYRFGSATVQGATLDQSFLDRDVVAGGATARFETDDISNILFVAQGVGTHYVHSLRGQPSNDSTSLEVLGGLDYQANGIWRYSLLAGVEFRSFAASQYGTQTAPVVEASAVWTPTAVLTLTGNLSRVVEDPELASSSGYVLTQAGLVVDYELMRSLLLQGRGNVQLAQYLQAGSQVSVSVGAGLTWLFSRNVRISLNDDYTQQFSSSGAPVPTTFGARLTGRYTQNLLALTLHIGF